MGYSWFDDYLLGYSTEAYKHFGAHFTEKMVNKEFYLESMHHLLKKSI